MERSLICSHTGNPCHYFENGLYCRSIQEFNGEETCLHLVEEYNNVSKDDFKDIMNLGMSLRQSQLNGTSFKSGNKVLAEWLKNKEDE